MVRGRDWDADGTRRGIMWVARGGIFVVKIAKGMGNWVTGVPGTRMKPGVPTIFIFFLLFNFFKTKILKITHPKLYFQELALLVASISVARLVYTVTLEKVVADIAVLM
jgi:hypothetical protein